MASKPMKRCSLYLIRELQIKTGDSAIHLLEWPKSKTVTHQIQVRLEGNRNSLFIAGRKAKWYSHFGTKFSSSHKITITLTIQSNSCAP